MTFRWCAWTCLPKNCVLFGKTRNYKCAARCAAGIHDLLRPFPPAGPSLGPMTLSLFRDKRRLRTVFANGQRYDLYASDDLRVWQPVATGYVGSSEDPYRVSTNRPYWFFQALSSRLDRQANKVRGFAEKVSGRRNRVYLLIYVRPPRKSFCQIEICVWISTSPFGHNRIVTR